MGSLLDRGFSPVGPVDLAFTPELNHWNGHDRIQLRIRDLRHECEECVKHMVYETVTDLDQLIDRLKSYNADADLGLVRKAYEFSAKAHEGQIRRSGEPYLQHPIAVAGV